MRSTVTVFGWQFIATGAIGFLIGVCVINLWGIEAKEVPSFQPKAGELAIFLLESDLFWGAESVKADDRIGLVKLQRRHSLSGACRLNERPMRVLLRGRLVGLSLSSHDTPLAKELMYAVRKPRIKLGVIVQKEAIKLKLCILRDAVTYAN